MDTVNIMFLISALLGMILPIALLAALQVWLCRKGKKLGLILPALSLAVSLLLSLSLAAGPQLGGGSVLVYDASGNLIQEEQMEAAGTDQGFTLGKFLPVAEIFLVFNIPTVIFMGIWIHEKNRRDWKAEFERMHIQDLE